MNTHGYSSFRFPPLVTGFVLVINSVSLVTHTTTSSSSDTGGSKTTGDNQYHDDDTTNNSSLSNSISMRSTNRRLRVRDFTR